MTQVLPFIKRTFCCAIKETDNIYVIYFVIDFHWTPPFYTAYNVVNQINFCVCLNGIVSHKKSFVMMTALVLMQVLMAIGIDHDTVCAGVVGTAIRNSTSCAGRRAAACGRAGRHNECCSGLQYQPRQRRPYKWSISILPRSQFYKKQGKPAFTTSCTAVLPHRRLRNDAWRRDS